MVVDVSEGITKSTKVTAVHRAACSGNSVADGGLVFRGEFARPPEEGLGVFLKGPDPEVFGALGVLVEVAAMALGSFGKAQGGPVGDFVEGALMMLGVVKAFREKGLGGAR